MRLLQILPAVTAILTLACNTDNGRTGSSGTNGTSKNPVAVAQQDTARDAWQKPEVIIQLMGGVEQSVKGKLVADLFAGDGYMTFKLIEAGANVIAIDTDPNALAAIEDRKRQLGLGDDRLRVRQVNEGEPGITNEEADLALSMHRIGYMNDILGYFAKVRQGLKAPKMVCIVDFLPSPSPMGPPMEKRYSETQMMDILEPAGFTDVGSYGKKLPYQYVMLALDFVPGPDTPGEEGVEVVPMQQ